MNKNRHIIGELQEFFANNDASKAINSISTIMNSIRIQVSTQFRASPFERALLSALNRVLLIN